jgi:16S rRNA (uracil1498-N3)-methyltransferase
MLPYFYQENLTANKGIFILDEDTSRHCSQVLRMQAGEALLLTNGRGLMAEAVIVTPNRKRTQVNINSINTTAADKPQFSLAIALTKNKSRNEWLLEKVTEMGVTHIYPIHAKRSEKEKVKEERFQSILIAAMLQSQQVFLPMLHEVQKLEAFLKQQVDFDGLKFIAHCEEGQEKNDYLKQLVPGKNVCVLIGPEGDFSPEEIEICLKQSFKPVSLGENRLRTETAGMYSCALFNAINNE